MIARLIRMLAAVVRRAGAARRRPIAALPAGRVPEMSKSDALREYLDVLAEHDAVRVRAQRTGKPVVWP